MSDLIQIVVCTGLVSIPFSVIGGTWWVFVDKFHELRRKVNQRYKIEGE